MNKTFLIFLSIAIASGLIFLYFFSSSSPKNTPTQPEIVGGPDGSPDGHGCIPGAGYSWCEIKNKCLRVWEEACK